MEPECIPLSQTERDRLRVLHEIEQGHLTQVEAACRLQITDRHVRRLLVGLQRRGDRALVHGLRGQPSNRKLDQLLEQRVLRRVRQHYADFGPTLAAEHLAKEGLDVSRETLRKWMSQAGLWCPRRTQVQAIHVWRPRRSRFGELVMLDSSRPRPGIDRVSSAWLIRRFIDPNAKFVFSDDPKRHPDAIPFDMFQAGGFGHRGEECTFETLRKEFAIRDPKVATLAEIIHDADLGDEKFGQGAGLGLDRVLIGWAQQGISDEELLRRGMELIDGLYHSSM
jgi:transposase